MSSENNAKNGPLRSRDAESREADDGLIDLIFASVADSVRQDEQGRADRARQELDNATIQRNSIADLLDYDKFALSLDTPVPFTDSKDVFALVAEMDELAAKLVVHANERNREVSPELTEAINSLKSFINKVEQKISEKHIQHQDDFRKNLVGSPNFRSAVAERYSRVEAAMSTYLNDSVSALEKQYTDLSAQIDSVNAQVADVVISPRSNVEVDMNPESVTNKALRQECEDFFENRIETSQRETKGRNSILASGDSNPEVLKRRKIYAKASVDQALKIVDDFFARHGIDRKHALDLLHWLLVRVSYFKYHDGRWMIQSTSSVFETYNTDHIYAYPSYVTDSAFRNKDVPFLAGDLQRTSEAVRHVKHHELLNNFFFDVIPDVSNAKLGNGAKLDPQTGLTYTTSDELKSIRDNSRYLERLEREVSEELDTAITRINSLPAALARIAELEASLKGSQDAAKASEQSGVLKAKEVEELKAEVARLKTVEAGLLKEVAKLEHALTESQGLRDYHEKHAKEIDSEYGRLSTSYNKLQVVERQLAAVKQMLAETRAQTSFLGGTTYVPKYTHEEILEKLTGDK